MGNVKGWAAAPTDTDGKGTDAIVQNPQENLGEASASDRTEISGKVMIYLYSAAGYLTGLYFIKPDIDASTLIRTAFLIHFLDAILCRLIASHSGRNKNLWTVAGLLLGIWALGPLFLFAGKFRKRQGT